MASMESPQPLRPQSRRPGALSLTPISTNTSSLDPSPSSSQFDSLSSELRELRSGSHADVDDRSSTSDRRSSADAATESTKPPQKTRSVLNLTSSTLFGIYSPAGYDSNRDEPLTPWGSGAQTPARQKSIDNRNTKYGPQSDAETLKEKACIREERQQERSRNIRQRQSFSGRRSAGARHTALVGRTFLLFVLGLAYGEVIAHLHDARNIAPVRVEQINRSSWQYLGFWGMAGVVLGGALPWIDELMTVRADEEDEDATSPPSEEQHNLSDVNPHSMTRPQPRGSLGADWNPIVRSIGAFVGIAFAVRKLPWQSTLQVSLTLALANPMIWYLMDRTRSGFALALTCGTVGAALLLSVNPQWIPSPATAAVRAVPGPSAIDLLRSVNGKMGNSTAEVAEEILLGIVSYESIGVATWISSVLFCSSIFFGQMGRILTLKQR